MDSLSKDTTGDKMNMIIMYCVIYCRFIYLKLHVIWLLEFLPFCWKMLLMALFRYRGRWREALVNECIGLQSVLFWLESSRCSGSNTLGGGIYLVSNSIILYLDYDVYNPYSCIWCFVYVRLDNMCLCELWWLDALNYVLIPPWMEMMWNYKTPLRLHERIK